MEKELHEVGERLVHCPLHCDGIINDPTNGIIPRGLIYERRSGLSTSPDRPFASNTINARRCIVIGLNPAKISPEEQDFYRDFKGILRYEDVCQELMNLWGNFNYYMRIRELITFLGYVGDILWTNLVKCECANGYKFESAAGKGIKEVPHQTKRCCVERFLRRELDLFPFSTIVAVGEVVFDFCKLSYPNHFILGIIHPTAFPPDFLKLDRFFRNPENPEVRDEVLKDIAQMEDEHGYLRAIKLPELIKFFQSADKNSRTTPGEERL